MREVFAGGRWIRTVVVDCGGIREGGCGCCVLGAGGSEVSNACCGGDEGGREGMSSFLFFRLFIPVVRCGGTAEVVVNAMKY